MNAAAGAWRFGGASPNMVDANAEGAAASISGVGSSGGGLGVSGTEAGGRDSCL